MYLPAKYVKGARNYVEFSYTTKSGSTKRVRRYFDRIKNKTERDKLALRFVRVTNERLFNGWRPGVEQKPDSVSLYEALAALMDLKQTFTRPRTMQTYKSRLNVFQQLTASLWGEELTCDQFGQGEAVQLMDELARRRKLTGRTYNNYLGDFKSWFNELVDRGHYSKSPFANVRPVKQKEPTNRAFSTSELRALVGYLKENEPYYYMACALCYYCALRPAEICRLQRHDFNLERGVVIVPGEKAKTGKKRFVVIPETFRAELVELLANVPPSWYVFGSGRVPAAVDIYPTRISDHWREVIRPALGFGKDLDFYGLKDTAAERLAAEGVDVAKIRDHFGHTNVAITDAYLKKRVAFVHEELKVSFPAMA